MSSIMDGRLVADLVKKRVAAEVQYLNKRGISVRLAVILVGGDAASQVYVNNKKKACEALGIISEEYALPETTTEQELLDLIKELNAKISDIVLEITSLKTSYQEQQATIKSQAEIIETLQKEIASLNDRVEKLENSK